jgi:acyl-CoA synthetase (AMP-forming)/AMP-acid ligase II
VLARNGLEAAVAIWACARAGLVQVGLPHDAPVARLRALLELTTPALLLTQPALHEAAVEAAAGVPVADAADVLLGEPRPWRTGAARPDQDTTYSLIPTSGTTGRPKAVRVTGRMTGHAAAFYARTLGLTAADRTAIHLPFAWVSGHVTQLTPAMLSGGSAVTMASFSAPALVDVALEHGVTWLDVVPSIWELLLRTSSFRLPELSAVRLAVFGGAPAPAGTLDRVRERLPQLRLVDVYALSETLRAVTVDARRGGRAPAGHVGRPAPYCEVRLVVPRAKDVPRGEPARSGCAPPPSPPATGRRPGAGHRRRLAAHRRPRRG